MSGNLFITFIVNGVFFALIIAILHITYKRQRTFTDYAVGGRSFSSWYIAFSYVNSWYSGTIWIAFIGLTVGSGVIGFYVLTYSLFGVATMYLMATRAWNWGQRFNLHTQPDMLRVRYNSKSLRVIASIIGVCTLFFWVVLAVQAMGVLFIYMSYQQLGITAALLLGLATIVVRQYWTVRMGMRGLVITDLVQGIIAYLLSAAMCVFILAVYFNGLGVLSHLKDSMYTFNSPTLGRWYFFSIIFTGIVGSLCWPTSYQRIYTSNSVGNVKRGSLQAMLVILVYTITLMLFGLAVSTSGTIAESPQYGWFIFPASISPWLAAGALLVVFAATMGWVDGCIQVCGAQIAKDIIGSYTRMDDMKLIKLAKICMYVYLACTAIVAYFMFGYAHLVDLAIIAYQGVMQLAIPLFGGLFWRRGTKNGALAGMCVGFVFAMVLTAFYPTSVPWLGGMTAGVPALAVNLLIYVGMSVLQPQSGAERQRVDRLFELGSRSMRTRPADVSLGAADGQLDSGAVVPAKMAK